MHIVPGVEEAIYKPQDSIPFPNFPLELVDDDDEEVLFMDDSEDICQDQHEHCSFWSSEGECLLNPDYMAVHCPKSCGTCARFLAQHEQCTNHDSDRESVDPGYLELTLIKSLEFGVKQAAIGDTAPATLARIEATALYMRDEKTLSLPFDILEKCVNQHELCSFWAVEDECEDNKAFMNLNCAPACFSCNLLVLNSNG